MPKQGDRTTVDGIEFIFDGIVWIGFYDPWTPWILTQEEKSRVNGIKARLQK